MINNGCSVPRSPLSRELQCGIAGVSRKEDLKSREQGGDNDERTGTYRAQLDHCGPIREKPLGLIPLCYTLPLLHSKVQEFAPPSPRVESPRPLSSSVGPHDSSLLACLDVEACESARLGSDALYNVWRYRNGGINLRAKDR
jgi:hypothetical protein